MDKCATCRHWGPVEGLKGFRLDHMCMRLQHVDYSSDAPRQMMALDDAGDGRFTQRLLTAPDFGCVLHQPAKPA